MQWPLQSWVRRSFDLWRTPQLWRRALLQGYLLVVATNSLFYYLLPSGHYDRNGSLAMSLLALLLLPATRYERLHALVMHVILTASAVLVFYMASDLGGINATVMVWLSVMPVFVPLLLGVPATLTWMALYLLGLFGLYLATAQGIIGADSPNTLQDIPWVLMNHVLVLNGLMLPVLLYQYLHQRQMRAIDARNTKLRKIHQSLIEIQAHKDEFLAAVGHELRTPMNATLGFNGVRRQELADRPEDVEVVDHIRRSTERLLQVVNDILDLSQLQAGRLTLRPQDFDLPALLRERVDSHREPALEKGLDCTLHCAVDVPVQVHADRHRLRQVLDNLIDNAIKFTPKGHVQVRACLADGRVRFEVEDTGIGIALVRQAHLFNRFDEAAVHIERDQGGTGLGLSLCERLMRLQGGRIGVRSELGQGALFWFELPMPLAQQAPAAPPQGELSRAYPLKVLLVDDNAVNLMVASLQLRKLWPQAEVVEVDNGPEAFRQLDAQAFDIALVDMVMPGMDGLQLTRMVRQSGGAAATLPIIALTANSHPDEHDRCLAAGMDAVLLKPIDPERLAQGISALVQRGQA